MAIGGGGRAQAFMKQLGAMAKKAGTKVDDLLNVNYARDINIIDDSLKSDIFINWEDAVQASSKITKKNNLLESLGKKRSGISYENVKISDSQKKQLLPQERLLYNEYGLAPVKDGKLNFSTTGNVRTATSGSKKGSQSLHDMPVGGYDVGPTQTALEGHQATLKNIQTKGFELPGGGKTYNPSHPDVEAVMGKGWVNKLNKWSMESKHGSSSNRGTGALHDPGGAAAIPPKMSKSAGTDNGPLDAALNNQGGYFQDMGAAIGNIISGKPIANELYKAHGMEAGKFQFNRRVAATAGIALFGVPMIFSAKEAVFGQNLFGRG